MALQGTIDTFPLTDVLHLLATSAKTGKLVLDGDRGSAQLWIEDGSVVGGSPAHADDDATTLVLALLRNTTGEFSFDASPDSSPEVSVQPAPLGSTIAVALELLAEWAAIEQVVPSPQHEVRLVNEIVGESITIDAAAWQLIASVAAQRSVGSLIESAGMGEFVGTRVIAGLVDRGLLEVHEPVPGANQPAGVPGAAPEVDHTNAASPEPVAAESVAPASAPAAPEEAAAFPDRFPIDDLIGGDGDESGTWTGVDGIEIPQHFGPDGVVPAAAGTDPAWDRLIDDALDGSEGSDVSAPEPVDTNDEVLKQMSRLSPQAAEAIAAALNAGTEQAPPDEPEAPISFLGTL